MVISLKPEHLKRYKDIAVLFMKYGRSDLVKSSGLSLALGGEDSPEAAAAAGDVPEASELAADLEGLGPTFIKLGQLLSTRADILPPPYLEALSRLQDNVGPFSFADVERIVEDDLGVRLSKAFNRFDSVPMASASLGQVHRAELRDGREVVVKIQRPDIREQIAKDTEALAELATFLDTHTEMGKKYDFALMLSEFRKSLLHELDYRDEAGHLTQFAENLRDFDLILIPRPVADFTSSRVLTMDYIHGKKITALHPIRRLEINGTRLAEQFFRAYLQQILVDGIFHADPHPGNVFLTEDERIALLDLGMVARIMSGFQDNLLRLLLAISDGRGEEAADITIRMGTRKEDFAEEDFTRDVADIVARHTDTSLTKIDAGRVVLEIQRIAAERGFRLPPEFTMIAKALLNLDQVVYTLAPNFDPNKVIRNYASEIMQQRMLKSLAPGNLMTNLLDVKDFLERLPARVNKILDSVGNNELELKVDAIDEKKLMEGLQKVANRITVGLIIAAMIIGASLLMRVETSFRLFGYPGLAIIFFLAAATAAVWLIVIILFYDETAEK